MTTTNITETSFASQFDHRLKLVEQTVLATIFIAALIGNILVLFIMMRKPNRRITRVAFFILHLTIADLLVAFFSVLPMLIWKSTITFFGGDFLCRVIAFLMLAVSYISVYTLVVMAYDRYQAIVHPLSSYDWSTRKGLCHMSMVWCLSLALASPQLFIFRVAQHPSYRKTTCLAKFPGVDRTWELVYIAWTILFQFLVPVILLTFFYTSVYLLVNRNLSMYCKTENFKAVATKKKKQHQIKPQVQLADQDLFLNYHASIQGRKGGGAASADRRRNRSASQQYFVTNHFLYRARLKTIKLTFIVVLTYILCSTPFYIGSIIMSLHEKFISQKTMNWLMTIFSLLFNLNSCSNPIICLMLSGTLVRGHNDHRLGKSAGKRQRFWP